MTSFSNSSTTSTDVDNSSIFNHQPPRAEQANQYYRVVREKRNGRGVRGIQLKVQKKRVDWWLMGRRKG